MATRAAAPAAASREAHDPRQLPWQPDPTEQQQQPTAQALATTDKAGKLERTLTQGDNGGCIRQPSES